MLSNIDGKLAAPLVRTVPGSFRGFRIRTDNGRFRNLVTVVHEYVSGKGIVIERSPSTAKLAKRARANPIGSKDDRYW